MKGRGFSTGCDDTGGGSAFGCSGDDEDEADDPRTNVSLVLLQPGRTAKETLVAISDAGSAEDGEKGHITWIFVVPDDYPLGPAFLKTEGSEPLSVRIVR